LEPPANPERFTPENARRLGLDEGGYPVGPGIAMGEKSARRTELLLINRKIRDANFRLQICEAYYDRCAVTGLRIINGGGRGRVPGDGVGGSGVGGPRAR
jgi:putative restriction endonuclease